MVDHTLDPIRVKFMTPEQAEKHMLIVKEKQENEKKRQEKMAFEANILKQAADDRKAKNEQPVHSLKGNTLNFGAKTVVFCPPANKGG